MATASRVASGSARVRPHTRELVERAMRDLLYVAPGRGPSTRGDRAARARAAEPRLPRPRPGDGGERDARRPRLDPLQHGRLAEPRGRLRPHAPRPARRRDDLHRLRGHGSPLRPRATTCACSRRARSSSSSTAARRRCTSPRSAWTSARPGGWPRSTCSRSAIALVGFAAGPEFTLPTREKRGRLRGGAARGRAGAGGAARRPRRLHRRRRAARRRSAAADRVAGGRPRP